MQPVNVMPPRISWALLHAAQQCPPPTSPDLAWAPPPVVAQPFSMNGVSMTCGGSVLDGQYERKKWISTFRGVSTPHTVNTHRHGMVPPQVAPSHTPLVPSLHAREVSKRQTVHMATMASPIVAPTMPLPTMKLVPQGQAVQILEPPNRAIQETGPITWHSTAQQDCNFPEQFSEEDIIGWPDTSTILDVEVNEGSVAYYMSSSTNVEPTPKDDSKENSAQTQNWFSESVEVGDNFFKGWWRSFEHVKDIRPPPSTSLSVCKSRTPTCLLLADAGISSRTHEPKKKTP